MVDRNLNLGVRITADGRALVSETGRAAQAVRDMGEQMRRVGDSGERLASAIRKIGHYGAGFIGLSESARLASSAVAAVFNAGVQGEKLLRVLQFTAGSAADAAREMTFLRRTARDLGLDFASAAQAYAKLAASANGTALAGAATREVFVGVSQAATALGLSGAETEGALLAVSQMMSKGVVAAEELRGQLGERIPGAFQIAARAMGVTTAELGRMLEQGQVLADQFLPRFAAELTKTFGASASSAAGGAQAQMNLLTTEWDAFKRSIAESGALAAAAKGLEILSAGLRSFSRESRAARLAERAAMEEAEGNLDKAAELRLEIARMGVDLYGGSSAREAARARDAAGRDDKAPPFPGAKSLDDVRKYAKTALDIERQWQAESVEIARAYANAIDAAEGDLERKRLARERDERLRALARDRRGELAKLGKSPKPAPAAAPEAVFVGPDIDRARQIGVAVREAIDKNAVTQAADYAAKIELLDRLFFEAGLDASLYQAALDELTNSTAKAGTEQDRLAELLGDTFSARLEKVRADMLLLAEALERGHISSQRFVEAAQARLGTGVQGKAEEVGDFAKTAAERAQGAFADFLFNPFERGLRGMLSGFAQTLHRMASEALAAEIFKKLFGPDGGAGFVKAIGTFLGFADGGYVAGPGTATSDSIPARLSDGEYVIRAAAVQRFGRGLFDALNGLTLPPAFNAGRLAFADGGLVQSAPAQAAQSVRIVNVVDASMAADYLNSSAGERVVLNILSRNAGALRNLIV